ncbi:carbohydrate ABC transporter permease [Angelakisella massiliensis]|nr:carbohydrate ABC transporter permease [Angelakisella massiliensis]
MLWILLAVFLIWTIFPLFWLVSTSFKGDKEILSNNELHLLPQQPTLQHYENAFGKTHFGTYISNSVKVTLISSTLVLAAAIMGGYALARYQFKGKKAIMVIMLASQMVPLITAIIPMFVLYSKLQLIDTLASLIITYTATNIPFCMITMSSFFTRIPVSLEEAAQIDGCNRFQSVVRVVLPVMLPSIVAVFVFAFTGCWNELFYSIMMINSEKLRTIPAGLMNFVQKYDIDWGQMSAAASVTLIPVVVMFFAVQKYIVAGLTAGSVKE